MHNFDSRHYYIFTSILSVSSKLYTYFNNKKERNMNLSYEFLKGCRFIVTETGSRSFERGRRWKFGF